MNNFTYKEFLTFNEEKLPIVSFRAAFKRVHPIDLNDEFGKLATTIDEVCQKVGGFFISDHGVDPKIINDVFRDMNQFFSLPLEDKLQVL